MQDIVCRGCGVTKPLIEFHHSSAGRYGRQTRCKVCCSIYNKNYRQNKKKDPSLIPNTSNLRLVSPKLDDYCKMYKFLYEMGYDLTKDVHVQFCERHNLIPKVRKKGHKNAFSPSDCHKKNP